MSTAVRLPSEPDGTANDSGDKSKWAGDEDPPKRSSSGLFEQDQRDEIPEDKSNESHDYPGCEHQHDLSCGHDADAELIV